MNLSNRKLMPPMVLVAVILAPVPFVIASFEESSEQMISHAFGTVALMSMSLALILSARPFGSDGFFGGLDKSYVVHKWLGISAFANMLIHDTLEAEVDGIPDQFGYHDLASDFGVWVYNSLLILVTMTFLHLMPYRWWRISHKFMVVIFALSLAHFVLIPKPLALGGLGGVYMLTFCILGLAAALFALRPRKVPRPVAYRVDGIDRGDAFTELTLVPEGAGIAQMAGQFVFLRRAGDSTLDAHPFTIRSAPKADESLRVAMATRSGWTKEIAAHVTKNDWFWVNGPYGRFTYEPTAHRQVWLSAGIGITPTLAWADAGVAPLGEIDIVHVCRSRSAAPDLSVLEAYAARYQDHVTLKVIETERTGRPNPKMLMRLVRDIQGRVDVYFCGPSSLEDDLNDALKSARKAKVQVHREVFRLRAGISPPKPIRDALSKLGEGLGWSVWLQRLGLSEKP